MRQARARLARLFVAAVFAAGCQTTPPPPPAWEVENPLVPLPEPPLGIDGALTDLPEPPTPERVRLGRWLFYDARLSADGTVSCGSCHRPEHAFSEPTPVSTGIDGQQGTRKSPTFVNAAFAPEQNFFWDGRASSLEEQALAPIENPIEMGNTHEHMIQTLIGVDAYKPHFVEAFGSEEITIERVTKASPITSARA
jgi:cytochrome c peroxidase